ETGDTLKKLSWIAKQFAAFFTKANRYREVSSDTSSFRHDGELMFGHGVRRKSARPFGKRSPIPISSARSERHSFPKSSSQSEEFSFDQPNHVCRVLPFEAH